MSIVSPAGTSQIPGTVQATPLLQTDPTRTSDAVASSAPPIPALAAAQDSGPQGLNQNGTSGTIVNTIG